VAALERVTREQLYTAAHADADRRRMDALLDVMNAAIARAEQAAALTDVAPPVCYTLRMERAAR
jgi:hypothetical protein